MHVACSRGLLPALAASLSLLRFRSRDCSAYSSNRVFAFEYIINRWMFGRPSTILNGSAVLTGLLLAFNLPSNLPIWIC